MVNGVGGLRFTIHHLPDEAIHHLPFYHLPDLPFTVFLASPGDIAAGVRAGSLWRRGVGQRDILHT